LSPAGYDLPHILTVNTVYELPVGQGKRFSTGKHVVDSVLGNWQVNGIFTVRSGQRYSVTDGKDQANTGNTGWAGYEQANLVGDPNSGTCARADGTWPVHSRGCWFHTTAFAEPAKGTFGNLRPDTFQAQRYWNLDFSIFRQFPLWSENHRLEFRAEAFNLFNTVIFGTPNSDINSPGNFGLVTSAANSPRVMQFGLKLMF